MKTFLKWTGIIVGSLLVIGFCAFLYLIPPFTLVQPEQFSADELKGPPSLTNIIDPKERMLAEHGKDIVLTTGCTGCHTAQGDQGPNWERYLAGGMQLADKDHGAFVSRNLTPDPTTGLARRSNEEVLRILRTGLNTEGRIIPHRLMPWGEFSHLTEEDRFAVLTYLRHLKPVHSGIPDPKFGSQPSDPAALEAFDGFDLSQH